jgi:hypothetical protein
MNTRALNSLADLICRAQEQGKRTPMGIAMAIESAGRHMSPEIARELEALRAREAELASYLEALKAQQAAVVGDRLTRTFAPTQALRELDGEFYAAVHHDYRTGRDLPEMGGPRV